MEIMRCESNVIMEWMNEIVLRQYKPMERMSGERLSTGTHLVEEGGRGERRRPHWG